MRPIVAFYYNSRYCLERAGLLPIPGILSETKRKVYTAVKIHPFKATRLPLKIQSNLDSEAPYYAYCYHGEKLYSHFAIPESKWIFLP